METGHAGCPDSEVLAAWVDRGLPQTEHAEVDAHLTRCADCRGIVTQVLEVQEAIGATGAPGFRGSASPGLAAAAARKRRLVLWGSGGALAIAATLLLLVPSHSLWWRVWRAAGVDTKLADLASAVGSERTVEARLTGGFHYGPLRAPLRSGGSAAAADNWTLYAAAGRIREDAERDASAANLHALGLAYLVLGNYDDAVRALEDAVAEASREARFHSDLAAAYLARAQYVDRPDDFPRALGAAERAIDLDASLVEARFNRALALEALSIRDEARRAWEDYLARDPASPWAEEARQHVQKLTTGSSSADPGPGRPPQVAETTVEAGVDWILRHGLPRWASAVLAGNHDEGARELQQLGNYAAQLSAVNGDPFINALVAVDGGDAVARQRRARGVLGLAQSLVAIDAENAGFADSELPLRCLELDGALAAICNLELAGIDFARRRGNEGMQRLLGARTVSSRERFIYLTGRADRLEGYRSMLSADYATAIESYRMAEERLREAKYLAQSALLAGQLADLYDLVGVPVEGWRWRLRALEVAATNAGRRPRFATHLALAEALARQQQFEASRTIVGTLLRPDSEAPTVIWRLLAAMTSAKVRLAAGDAASAREHLAEAQRLTSQTNDFRAKAFAPDLLTLEAAICRREQNADCAVRALGAAIGAMGPERAAHRATALLARASVGVQVDSEGPTAANDVREAMDLLRRRSTAPFTRPLRFDDGRAALSAIAWLVESSAALQNWDGLHLLEEVREAQDGANGNGLRSSAALRDAAAGLPDGGQAIVFLFGERSLLAWSLTRSGVSFHQRAVDPGLISLLTNTLTVQVTRQQGEHVWRPTLAKLYDVLLRDLPGVAAAADLLVVPDGMLHRVPFGALFDREAGRYVFERATVRQAPNLSLGLAADGAAPVRAVTAVAIGAPLLSGPGHAFFRPLPRAKQEAVAIAALYPKARSIVGDEATKERVLEQLQGVDVVHYAGHALAPSSAGPPRLLLSGNIADPRTSLSAADLAARFSGRTRVVLASCQTGAAPIDRAAGVGSIAADFLRAGASGVAGTLWQVDDASSEPFFIDVHRSLSRGTTLPQAVARAQRACLSLPACRKAPATWIDTTVYGSS